MISTAPATDRFRKHVRLAQEFIRAADTHPVPSYWSGRGIVTAAGGVRLYQLYVLVRSLRGHLGCTLPVQCYHLGQDEVPPEWRRLLEPLGVQFTDLSRIKHPWKYGGPVQWGPSKEAYSVKTLAIWYSRFMEVLWLDSDCIPVRDPSECFDWPEYLEKGIVLWPDIGNVSLHGHPWLTADSWKAFGLSPPPAKHLEYPGGDGNWARRAGKPIDPGHAPWLTIETGQQVIDKRRAVKPLLLSMHYVNDNYPYYRQFQFGEKDALMMACRVLNYRPAVPLYYPGWDGSAYRHFDFHGEEIFYHRCQRKFHNGFNATADTPEGAGYRQYLNDLSREIRSWGAYDWCVAPQRMPPLAGTYFLDIEEGAYGWYRLEKDGGCHSQHLNKDWMNFVTRWEVWDGPRKDDVKLVLMGPHTALDLEWDGRLGRWRGASGQKVTLTRTAVPGRVRRRPLVCGIPTLHRYDLLERCLSSLLRGTVVPDRVFVIDNGGRYFGRYCTNPLVNVVRPTKNLGVPRSFNLIAKLAGEADTLILNDDLVLGMETVEKMLAVDAPVVCCFHWSGYLQTRGVWATIGEYDENYYPAYFDDVDYRRRLELAGVRTAHVFDPEVRHEYGASGGVGHKKWEELRAYKRTKWARFEGTQ